MQNTSPVAVDTILAFPLPLLEGPELANVPVDVDPRDPERFVDFVTTVDGVAVKPQQEIRAYAMGEDGQLGREVTAELKAAGVLISPLGRELYEHLAALPPDVVKTLAASALVDVFEHGNERNYTPLWAVQYTYFSKQRFEPGKIVRIHHEYTPVAGRSLFGEFGFTDELKKWCVDAPTEKALHAAIAAQPVAGGWAKVLERREVEYILKTGANWAGPIRSFELTIAKDHPGQLVSLCIEGLKRISDTEFRVTIPNFTPREELAVAFFEPIINGR